MDPWTPEEGAQHGSRLLAKASRRRQEAGVKGCSATLLKICAPALTAPQSESEYEHLQLVKREVAAFDAKIEGHLRRMEFALTTISLRG